MIERKLETRSIFRSVRYRVSRGESIQSADPSSCNFRIKRNTCADSTLYRTLNSTQGAVDLKLKELTKTNYLQTFNSMMQRSERLSKQEMGRQNASFF